MEAPQRIEALRRDAAVLKSLLEHPGWRTMLEGVEAHVAARMGELVKPLDDSGNAAARQEFIKGEIAGIQTFQAFPQSLVESAEAKIMDLASQIEDEESNGN